MKILYLTPFPIVKSSSGLYTKNLAGYFLSHGHNPVIINIDNENYKYDEDVKIMTIPFSKITDFEFPCFTTHPHTNNKFYTMNDSQIHKYHNILKQSYEKIITSFEPDIIHSQYLWVNAAIVGEITDIPQIVTAFGNEINAVRKDLRYKEYVDNAIESATYIVAPSKQIEQSIKKDFGLDRAKLRQIYSGYDDANFKFIEGKTDTYREYFSISSSCSHLILFHDNLSQIKGFGLFLDASKQLLEKRDDVCFIVSGKGEYKQQLDKAMEAHPKHYIYFENLTDEEIPLINHIADVKVMPVRYERFGTKALEALAMGTPVIASDAGEMPYFINENTGVIIEDINSVKLADAMNRMVTVSKDHFSLFCHQYAERNYSKSAGLKLMNRLYKHTLNEE
ncbi:MAG: glycosyltransferase family 4 protein [candidate division WOR-3 bacterium]|nr:glycosyltransferase family 4 protein [candidate division WOR-3 bacterium]